MPSIRTILHPTDLSDHSRYAFETACDLARDHQARLFMLHVMLPTTASFGPMPNPLEPAESQEALAHWGFAWPQPADSKVRVEHRVAEGDAAEEILRLARTLPCDLIVMGTHGRTGLGVRPRISRHSPFGLSKISFGPSDSSF
jgi:nucleotide-binding universal stress UspA family protein